MLRLLVVLVLLLGQDPPVELVYRLKFPEDFKGDRAATSARTLDVVRKRLEALHPSTAVKAGEGETLVVTAPLEKSAEIKKTVPRPGTMSLRMTADRAVQQAFVKDGMVPEGWRAWDGAAKQVGEYESYGGRILLRDEPVVDHRHLLAAEARAELVPGGRHWVVSFELNEEGSRRFDAAAKVLYGRRPPGLLAIVVDDAILSLPAVMTDRFGGQGQISGQKNEAEAKETARLLLLGPLPVPLDLEAERRAEK